MQPFGNAVVWGIDGLPTTLPVVGPFEQAVADGFNRAGAFDEPVGIIAPVGQAGGPAVVWREGVAVALPLPGQFGVPRSGNGPTIVGAAIVSAPAPYNLTRQACLWQDGTYTLLSVPNTNFSTVNSINNAGFYIGNAIKRSDTSPWVRTAFRGQGTNVTPMEYPGYQVINAFEINDDNQFVGYHANATGAIRSFVATDTEIHDLGLFPGYAETYLGGINNDGVIVGGGVRNIGENFSKAFIWPAGTYSPIDLNQFVNIPNVTLTRGMDINNAGQILAEGFDSSAQIFRYYRLDPIPEPSALAVPLIATQLRRRRALAASKAMTHAIPAGSGS